ncbi:hypothetical protein BVRB_6g128950 [Beta vulgaris subsp. vulgaris]|nr:hypothetical protein BVRB_6g128950 [Beta vulgaris subsp. vulgaris]
MISKAHSTNAVERSNLCVLLFLLSVKISPHVRCNKILTSPLHKINIERITIHLYKYHGTYKNKGEDSTKVSSYLSQHSTHHLLQGQYSCIQVFEQHTTQTSADATANSTSHLASTCVQQLPIG